MLNFDTGFNRISHDLITLKANFPYVFPECTYTMFFSKNVSSPKQPRILCNSVFVFNFFLFFAAALTARDMFTAKKMIELFLVKRVA